MRRSSFEKFGGEPFNPAERGRGMAPASGGGRSTTEARPEVGGQGNDARPLRGGCGLVIGLPTSHRPDVSRPLRRVTYVFDLFFAVLFGVDLHCFLGVPTSVNDVRPRGMRVVRRLLVVPALVMLGRLSMMMGGVCQMLGGLFVVFCGFLRHLCSS